VKSWNGIGDGHDAHPEAGAEAEAGAWSNPDPGTEAEAEAGVSG
jgi:hypothetical protein